MKIILLNIWSIATHIFAIAVVLIAFHVAKTQFEIMVVFGLVMIFVTAKARHSETFEVMAKHNKAGFLRFIELLGALDSPKTTEYANAGNEGLANEEAVIDSWWINSVTDGIIVLIALYELATVVLS